MTVGRIPSVEGGIQPTIVDAKGDLIAAVAADSLNRLAVGSNDQVLVADSAASTGLAWKSYATPFAAGKNKIINGAFDIWQRGTSISLTNTTTAFVADRFTATSYFTAGTSTFTQQSFTPGTAPASPYESPFFGRLTLGSTATYFELAQKIEDVRTCAGQAVTFSFWAKASVSTPFNVIFRQNFGTGGSSNVDIFGTATTLTTSWQRFTFTTTLGAMTGKTIGAGSNLQLFIYASGSVTNSQTIDTWGWQLEQGSTATPFQTATGTIQGELAACQRYYFNISGADKMVGMGAYQTSLEVNTGVTFPVTMRTSPTFSATTGTGFYGFKTNGSEDLFDDFVGTAAYAGNQQALIYSVTNVSGTAGRAGGVRTVSANAKIEFSAEL